MYQYHQYHLPCPRKSNARRNPRGVRPSEVDQSYLCVTRRYVRVIYIALIVSKGLHKSFLPTYIKPSNYTFLQQAWIRTFMNCMCLPAPLSIAWHSPTSHNGKENKHILGKSTLWEKQTDFLFSLTIDIFQTELEASLFHSCCSHGKGWDSLFFTYN